MQRMLSREDPMERKILGDMDFVHVAWKLLEGARAKPCGVPEVAADVL